MRYFSIIFLILLLSMSFVLAETNETCASYVEGQIMASVENCSGETTVNPNWQIESITSFQYTCSDGTTAILNSDTNGTRYVCHNVAYWEEIAKETCENTCQTFVCPEVEEPTCEEGKELVKEYDSDDCLSYNCKEVETVCTKEYNPVCGGITVCPTTTCETNTVGDSTTCEGGECETTTKTYSNKCFAEQAGATILYGGECETTPICKEPPIPSCEEGDELVKGYDSDDCLYYECEDNDAEYFSESVKCVFVNSSNAEKCYDGSGKYSCSTNSGNNTFAVEDTCSVEVKEKKGTTLNWKSSCGGYGDTEVDGISEYVDFDCGNTGAITERVKCILNGASGGEECYSAKGKCTVNISEDTSLRNRYGTCSVPVRGEKGETVTWKSDCGGYAYTIMDGESEYAKFECRNTKPPVEEKFKGAKWTCTNEMEFSKDSDDDCKPYSYWKSLATRTCNSYSTKCATRSRSGNAYGTTTSVTDSNGVVVTIVDDSNAEITKCLGGEITVKEFDVGEQCESTCTRYLDSQGCKVTKCDDIETVDCPNQSCRDQPIDEIRKIKDKCYANDGKVLVEIDNGTGCSNYTCVSVNSSNVCRTLAEVPTEKIVDCEENGGKFIYKVNDEGCLAVMDCVGIARKDKNINKDVINDSTKLLELALKLESLKISLGETKAKIQAMADYYNGNNDTNSASNFENAIELLETAIQKIDSLKEFIKDNVDTFSEEDAKQVRTTIGEIKENLLKEVLLAILG